jgi:hypothetical protein
MTADLVDPTITTESKMTDDLAIITKLHTKIDSLEHSIEYHKMYCDQFAAYKTKVKAAADKFKAWAENAKKLE